MKDTFFCLLTFAQTSFQYLWTENLCEGSILPVTGENRSIYLGNKMSEKSNLNKERVRLDYEDGEVMAT